jgi:hypothetical protein
MGIYAWFLLLSCAMAESGHQLLGKEVPAFVNEPQNSRPKTVFSINKQPCDAKKHQSQNKRRQE